MVLYFPEGRFIIHDDSDRVKIDPDSGGEQVLEFTASHFILRGAGADKTTLWMKTHLLPLSPNKKWSTPYLLQLGFLERTSQGRLATQKAYEHMGVPYGKDDQPPRLF